MGGEGPVYVASKTHAQGWKKGGKKKRSLGCKGGKMSKDW